MRRAHELIVPVHHQSFRLSNEPFMEPIERIQEALARRQVGSPSGRLARQPSFTVEASPRLVDDPPSFFASHPPGRRRYGHAGRETLRRRLELTRIAAMAAEEASCGWQPDALARPERFVDGMAQIPERPGFGVALNEDVIRARALPL